MLGGDCGCPLSKLLAGFGQKAAIVFPCTMFMLSLYIIGGNGRAVPLAR
jgi:hypothetical protein